MGPGGPTRKHAAPYARLHVPGLPTERRPPRPALQADRESRSPRRGRRENLMASLVGRRTSLGRTRPLRRDPALSRRLALVGGVLLLHYCSHYVSHAMNEYDIVVLRALTGDLFGALLNATFPIVEIVML